MKSVTYVFLIAIVIAEATATIISSQMMNTFPIICYLPISRVHALVGSKTDCCFTEFLLYLANGIKTEDAHRTDLREAPSIGSPRDSFVR